jgi:hypothetical protein
MRGNLLVNLSSSKPGTDRGGRNMTGCGGRLRYGSVPTTEESDYGSGVLLRKSNSIKDMRGHQLSRIASGASRDRDFVRDRQAKCICVDAVETDRSTARHYGMPICDSTKAELVVGQAPKKRRHNRLGVRLVRLPSFQGDP